MAKLFSVCLFALLTGCGVAEGVASDAPQSATETDAAIETDAALEDGLSLGGSYDAAKANITFRVFSSRATRLEVWIYKTPSGAQEVAKYVLTKNATTNVWSKTVSVATLARSYGLTGAVYYGYRAWGPNWPYTSAWRKGTATGFISDVDGAGNRFNPNKLLSDPYARELSHDPGTPTCLDGTLYGTGASHRTKDSGACAPKGVVLATDTTSIGTKPTRALKDDIIYEVHVSGLTKNDLTLPAALRGTYAGAATRAAYLASLGSPPSSFCPVQETQNDTNDVDPNSTTGRQLLGLHDAELLRAGPPLFLRQDARWPHARVQGDGQGVSRRRAQGLHRRGLQPHRRGRFAWGGTDGQDPTTCTASAA
jgi:isoamylase